ncbi:hypothetical protein OUZ56_027821 [Daphnia magna]|uniref:Uncharacterized protein n=1 Tax=Daphnia magna TaxID=35525 RepID=A0ABR0B210_9CRUS|nr:hypothetical protein OUZ56_027821 [Daphnia magna]
MTESGEMSTELLQFKKITQRRQPGVEDTKDPMNSVSQILYDDTFFEGTFPEEIRTFNDAFRENTENMEDRRVIHQADTLKSRVKNHYDLDEIKYHYSQTDVLTLIHRQLDSLSANKSLRTSGRTCSPLEGRPPTVADGLVMQV